MISTGRKGGRPIRPGVPGARVSLGLKVTPEIKNKLDEAARLNGRTQSAEAEYRLERSFERQDLLREVWVLTFGDHLADQYIALAKKAKIGLSEEVIEKLVKTYEKALRDEVKRDAKWGPTK